MEHNSEGLEDDFPLQMGDFQVPYLFSRVYQTSKSLFCFLLVSVFFFNHCKLRRFWPGVVGWLCGSWPKKLDRFFQCFGRFDPGGKAMKQHKFQV